MDRKTEVLNYLKLSPLRVNDMGMCDICQKYWEENH